MDAVITGASTGIGRATALRLCREGWRVFAGVRREADGERLVAEGGERLVPVIIDVVDAESVEAAGAAVRAALGDGAGLHGLVNNAGIPVGGPVEFVPLEEWRRALEVNVIGQVAVIQEFLPLLRAQRGRVVNMGSIGGRLAAPFVGPYGASKFAMEAVTDALRMELRKWGIWVAIIEPGSIATPIWDKTQSESDSLAASLPPAARELYGRDFEAMTKTVQRIAARGLPPERVADAVLHALTAQKPKPRYVIGRESHARLALNALLSTRMMDALMARLTGVGK